MGMCNMYSVCAFSVAGFSQNLNKRLLQTVEKLYIFRKALSSSFQLNRMVKFLKYHSMRL